MTSDEAMSDQENAKELKDAELRRIGLLYATHKIDKAAFDRRWAEVEKKPLSDFIQETRTDD